MITKATTTTQVFIRSMATGVLLSMLFFYGIHVLGDWSVVNYRPNPDTTSTLLLHNTCAVFGKMHTLRPNNGMPNVSNGINGSKLAGSFMNFTDGHIVAMLLVSIVIGIAIFAARLSIKKRRQ